ncbi:hypothetical protein P873_07385 [Arenimonas composti TR7-09 = DSM 18010]|uniref:NAD(P)-binding domain-containing protein n=1 Tax=Arenimonas composti TR7-09 = DSM 18010 TaxID=1121013 RepID=A0A091BCV7_9GAMM|nr:hypothetical protein P873_07385 [Arenimonas composti TR7-09 = DSM 18010]
MLVTGATGLIGAAIVDGLRARGDAVIAAVRDPGAARSRWPGIDTVAVDFAVDLSPVAWQPRLAGADAVVNAVGTFVAHGKDSFEAVHAVAPRALFAACEAAGVARVIQISALGADAGADVAFQRSKALADEALLASPLTATVLRPSLVYAPDGASSAMFLAWSTLPWLPLPGDGRQRIQPVVLDDVVAAVLAALDAEHPPRCVDVVGPRATTLRDYLATLRRALGLPPARVLPVPRPLLRAAVALSPPRLASPDALAMLDRGNHADPSPLTALLGRPPQPVEKAIPPGQAASLRRAARLRWTLPPLRWTVALVWLWTAAVSFGLYPPADSLALLARVDLHGFPALVALYGAAALDAGIGLALLRRRRARALYRLQIAVILAYTVLVTVFLPEFWLHPYGPISKNLPLLAALLVLHELDTVEAR